FSSASPICCTAASAKPISPMVLRSWSMPTGWEKLTSISEPPAKSTPRFSRNGMRATMRRIVAIEAVMKVRRLARKSKFVPGLMISMNSPVRASDGERRPLRSREQGLVDEPRHEDRGEEGGDDPDAQRDGEASHGPGAVLQEHEGRHEGCHVGV